MMMQTLDDEVTWPRTSASARCHGQPRPLDARTPG